MRQPLCSGLAMRSCILFVASTGIPISPEPWALGYYTLRYHGTIVSVCKLMCKSVHCVHSIPACTSLLMASRWGVNC